MVVPPYDLGYMQEFFDSLPSNKQYLLKVFSRYLITDHVLLDENWKARNTPLIDPNSMCQFFYKEYSKLCAKTKKAGCGGDPDDDPFYYDGDDDGDESDDEDADLDDADLIPIPKVDKDISAMDVNEIGREFAIWILRRLLEFNEEWQSVLSGVLFDVGSYIRSLWGRRGELIANGRRMSTAKNEV